MISELLLFTMPDYFPTVIVVSSMLGATAWLLATLFSFPAWVFGGF